MSQEDTNGEKLVEGLRVILIVQQKLQEAMGWPSGRGVDAAKDNLLHAHTEIDEALNEVNWKPHKRHRPEYGTLKDRTRYAMELTEAIQTIINAGIAYDLTPEELAQALIVKWGINFDDIADGEVTHAQ